MRRRDFLTSMTLLAGLAVEPWSHAAERSLESIRSGWRLLLPGSVHPPRPTDSLELDDAAWQRVLTPERYRVMRHEATEQPFSSELNDEFRPGIYLCAACGLPLFASSMKFDAETGWPSFFTTIPGAVETREDRFVFYVSTEYHCRRCGGHQGHVFHDGPEPTYQRWCNNGIALRFVAKEN